MQNNFLPRFKRSLPYILGLYLLMSSTPSAWGQKLVAPNLEHSQDSEDSEDSEGQDLDASSEDCETTAMENKSCIPKFAPFKADKLMHAEIKTSLGTLCCTLFAGVYPLTVLNFRSLSNGAPPWTDAQGQTHDEAYYSDLPFGQRIAGAYVISGLRPEGVDFVVIDEHCQRRQEKNMPLAGSLLMIQAHPGTASTQFLILARNQASFHGMYANFGHCAPLETIDALTRKDAKILEIRVKDDDSCKNNLK